MKIFESKTEIDLEKLIDSRMLICASAGGGKSYFARKILEESNKKVMSIVFDIEGEFKTLREKFDFLLIGEDGDVPLSMQSAKVLPKKLLELNVPTIIDISELKHRDRTRFVKEFLESMMELHRKYWKPCLVFIDEVHRLCGQMEKQDSVWAIIDLMTRGRKRGFCGILMTQRIAKLHKDAAAECTNVAAGRINLDIDMKRMADILGFKREQMLELREQKDGQFFVYGSAISKKVIQVQVAKCITTHPKRGQGVLEVSKPTDRIKSILRKITDLPKDAQKELKELSDYRKEVSRLQRELTLSKRNVNKEKIINVVDNKAIERVKKQGFDEAKSDMMKEVNFLRKENHNLINLMDKIGSLLKVKPVLRPEYSFEPKTVVAPTPSIITSSDISRPTEDYNLGDKLSPAYQRILNAIALYYPEMISKPRISMLSNVPQKASTFRNGLSKLKMNGLIKPSDGGFIVTDEGIEIASDEKLPEDSDELIKMWKSRLSPAYARMFEATIKVYPNPVSKEDMSFTSDVPMDASTFRNGLSKLKTLGLVEINSGQVTASRELFE